MYAELFLAVFLEKYAFRICFFFMQILLLQLSANFSFIQNASIQNTMLTISSSDYYKSPKSHFDENQQNLKTCYLPKLNKMSLEDIKVVQSLNIFMFLDSDKIGVNFVSFSYHLRNNQ